MFMDFLIPRGLESYGFRRALLLRLCEGVFLLHISYHRLPTGIRCGYDLMLPPPRINGSRSGSFIQRAPVPVGPSILWPENER